MSSFLQIAGRFAVEAFAAKFQRQVNRLHVRFISILLISVGLFPNSSATAFGHKFSGTSQATSPRRNTRRQCGDDSPALQVGCSEVTRDQHGPNADRFDEIREEVSKKLRAFYQFCRPHTIYGTVSFDILD